MRTRQVPSWWRQWTVVGGTCSPPASPARTIFEHAVDRYVAVANPFLRGCLVFLVVGAVAVASVRLGPEAGLTLVAAYLIIHATHCLANFLRCREAHCIVTGTGWLVLAGVAAGGALTQQDVRSAVWDAFLAVTIAGFGFEFVWKAIRGSSALTLR